MNLGALRTEIRQELQEASAGEWTNAELDAYVNDGVLLTTQLLEWYEKTTNLVPGAGTQDYTLPTDNLRLHRVTFDREFLPQTTQYELDRDEGNWRGAGNNNPIRFFIKQWDTLSAYPKPLTAGTSVSFTEEENTATAATSGGTFASFDYDTSIALNAWSNPSNALASDNSYATATVTSIVSSESLRATNFGFSIPSDAIILGILAEAEGSRSGGDTNLTNEALLTYQGANIGSSQGGSALFTTSDAYVSYGGSTNIWGYASLTPAIINASTFGVDIRASNSGTSSTARVDHIRITVYYLDDSASGENGEVVAVEDPADTIDPDVTFDSQLGVVIAMEDSEGGHVRFEPDFAADAFSLGSSELGCVIDYDTDEGNFGLYYAALPDTLVADTDVPQIHQAVHPALIPYAAFRALEREGPMQDLRLAQGYFNDMADWLQSVMLMKHRQWPERSMSLEPVGLGNEFVRRLNEVGTGTLPKQQTRAHYE